MEEIYLLGVDVGTSSIKVTVIDQEARFVAQESAAYRLINPNQVSIQIDTADMWNAFTGCVGALISKHGVEPGKIKAIGMSSHNPGIAERAMKTGIIDVLMFSINPVYDLMPEGVVIDDLTNMETYQQRD